MSKFASRIKPLLEELDVAVPLDRPVQIDDLIPLFKKHSGIPEILLYPIDQKSTLGVHLRQSDRQKVHIFYKECVVHRGKDLEPSCPGCQTERFVIAKELSHTLDCDEETVQPAAVEDKLLDELLKGSWSDDPLAQSDHLGRTWALELLIRFCQRTIMNGDCGLPPSMRLTAARASSDFSDLARQFAVPQWIASHAFGEAYMGHMKEIRQRVGLPVRPTFHFEGN